MPHLAGSLMLLGLIALFAAIYSLFSWQQARVTGKTFNYIFGATGYGFIPLVLGGFLAVYFEMFMAGAWRFIPLVLSAFWSLPGSRAQDIAPGGNPVSAASYYYRRSAGQPLCHLQDYNTLYGRCEVFS